MGFGKQRWAIELKEILNRNVVAKVRDAAAADKGTICYN